MANPVATLTKLLSSTTIEDHEEVLKATNAVLRTAKRDADALHTRVIALLKLDRYADALRALDEGGDALAAKCPFEKSYALYKMGDLEGAQEIFKSARETRALKHVAAQVAYRAERFEDASRIYAELSVQDAGVKGEENDLRINTLAVDAQLQWAGRGGLVPEERRQPSRDDVDAFETTYNAACSCIGRGELEKARVLLERARTLCEGLEELSDEEKRGEMLPIMVQLVFVYSKLGREEDAQVMQRMIDVEEIPENPTKLIAQINALASQKHDNPFLAARLLETQPKLAPTEALFSYQSNILTNNRYALDLETLKHEGVSRSTKKATTDAQPTTSSSINTLSVFHAAAHTQGKDTAASIKALRALLDNHPLDVGLILSLVQLYVSSNNLAPAVQLLESFFSRLDSSNQDVRYAPGLVALLVTLYKHQGRSAPAAAALNEAAKYWSDKGKQNDELLRAAGLALLESSSKEDLETAAGFFKSLKKGGGEDKLAFAGYVASVATTDIDSVRPHLDQLTSVEDLIAGVDAEALENAGIASLPVTMVDASKKRATATAATQEGLEKPKKKRVRQSQLPKEFVEGKTMDPERWLPLKDRSNYKPKGKKGKGKGREDRTQGGVVREEEQLTLAAGAGVVKVQNAPSKSQKKKKGKK